MSINTDRWVRILCIDTIAPEAVPDATAYLKLRLPFVVAGFRAFNRYYSIDNSAERAVLTDNCRGYHLATPGVALAEQIGDPTLADGILDRLVHNAHRIGMRGDSMGKIRGKPRG